MPLDDVRAQLRDLSDRVPAGSSAPDEVFRRTRRAVRRRQIARGSAAVAAVAVITVVAIAVGASGPTPKKQVIVSESTTTTTEVATPPPLPFTAEQLRAHDGVGAPAGWAPVDMGAARVWVPAEWVVEATESCYGGVQGGLVGLGRIANGYCQSASQSSLPADVVSLVPSTQKPARTPDRIVHGYRVFVTYLKCLCPWRAQYEVPQLGVQIISRGDVADRIVATLAPSARAVALAFAAQPTPNTLRLVERDGVSLAIPRTWSVETAQGMPCNRTFGSAPELLRIPPDLGVPSCPFVFPTAATAAGDGIELYTAAQSPAPDRGGHAVVVLHHDATTITVYEETGADALDLFVQKAGSPTTHVLTLGLGRDGRVAGRILATIAATT